MGLADQLGEFSSNLSKEMEPLRALLSKKNIFNWTEAHTKAFNNVKDELCQSPILKNFDPSKETCL